MEGIRCMLVSWEDIERWTKDVVRKIRESGYRPDVVVGLARGGLVPARLVSDYLLIKDLYVVKTEHWGITATRDGEARLAQGLQVSVEGRRVLIVDDITDTGKSIGLAVEHVREFNPAEVRTATLLHITHSAHVPHYYSQEVPAEEWTWFIFPWNMYEDLRNLIPRAMDGPMTLGEIMQALQKAYGIKPRESVVREVLDDLVDRGVLAREGEMWVKR